MKRVISILLVCLMAVLPLTACSKSDDEVLNIGGAEISSGIYAYFLNEAVMHPEGKGITPQEQALKMCKEYVAVNTIFRNNGYKLSSATKKNVSVEANAAWRIYEQYYKAIGVNKQEFIAVSEFSAKRMELINRYYGSDGLFPVPENEVQQYFKQHFIVFQSISGYFTATDENGNTVNLDAKEADALRNQFKAMAEKVSGGTPIEEVSSDYLAAQGGSQSEEEELSAVIMQETETSYPKGFYEQVAKMNFGSVKVIELGQYIFLVKRLDPLQKDAPYYTDSIERCLEEMKGDDIKNVISEEIAKYDIVQHKGKMKKCMNKIEKRREGIPVTDAATEVTSAPTKAK